MSAVDEGEIEIEDVNQDQEVPEEESQVPGPTLEDYLRSNDGQEMSDAELSELFRVKKSDVKRMRRVIAGQTVSAPQTNGASSGVQGIVDALPETPAGPPDDEDPYVVKPGLRVVTVADLDLDAGTRIRDLDAENVKGLVEAMTKRKSTSGFGLLGAMFVPELNRILLTDGFHRIEASRDVFGPAATWEADIKVGTYHDALREAFRANRTHGKRLSREDRVLIVERVLDDPEWGPAVDGSGANWTDKKIAELVGEPSREFIAEVRAEWLKKNNLEDPENRTFERGGKTYQTKAKQDRKSKNPREEDDHAEDGEMEAGTETADQRKRDADHEYLKAVTCRAHIHPDALPSVDKAALARRDLTNALQSLKTWCAKRQDDLGVDHPLFVAVDRACRIPPAIKEGEHSTTWTACPKCRDENGLSTGLVTIDGQVLSCKACSGTAFKMPGLR